MCSRAADGQTLRDRLLLGGVIVTTTAFVWIDTLSIGVAALGAALVCLALAHKLTSRFVLFVLTTTMGLYFLGNWLFSPVAAGGLSLGPFQMNELGVYRGATAALKRGAMIGVSLAWITSTPLPRLYSTLSFLPGHWWLALFLRNLQIMRRDITLARYSLLLRSRSARIPRVLLRIIQLRLAIQSAVLRAFYTIPRLTYAAEVTRAHVVSTPCTLELRDVSIRYDGGSAVLEHVNVRINPGEFVYVDGVSQSGRTTLLCAMAGYIPKITGQLAGDVLINDVKSSSLALRDLAALVRYVPSEAERSLLGLTVGREILLYTADEGVATEALRQMGLLELWDQETSSLSGGEQVRLLIAGILVSPPGIVVFDAPLEQLDSGGRREFLWALSELRSRREVTVVVADNQQEELREMTSRVLVVGDGGVREFQATSPVSTSAVANRSRDFAEGPDSVVAAMQSVRVVLGGRTILNDVSFDIRRGECVAITGPNGSGKTTAMLALAGLVPVVRGSIRVDGLFGYVFQDPATQMVELTVGEELLVEPRFARWDRARRERFRDRALAWTGALGDGWTVDLHAQIARFVSIAAMVPEKAVLALDEPSIGLDDVGVERLLARVAELREAGVAMFLVTHDPRVARFADRVVQFKEGQTSGAGRVTETIQFSEEQQRGSGQIS